MKAKRLSSSILNNTILPWGDHCSKCKDYRWTKHDSNAVFLAHIYIKDKEKESYQDKKEQSKFIEIMNKVVYRLCEELVRDVIRPVINENGMHFDYWEVSLSNYAKEKTLEVVVTIMKKYKLKETDYFVEVAKEMTIASMAVYLLMNSDIYETYFDSKT